MSSWNFLCFQLSVLPPSFLPCNSEKSLASSYLWPSPLAGGRLLSDCATPISLLFCKWKKPAPLSLSLDFVCSNQLTIVVAAFWTLSSLLSLVGVGSGLKTRLSVPEESAWVLSTKNNHSSQPTAFNLANAAWCVVNFHCHKSLLLIHVQPAVHQSHHIFFCRSGPSTLFHSLC